MMDHFVPYALVLLLLLAGARIAPFTILSVLAACASQIRAVLHMVVS